MKNRGYIVPEPIDPESTACIRVYVPNHQLYIAAFMRAYVFFGEWVAWERDAEGKAKLAAAVWRNAIERTQAEFDCAEGECGIMDIRQNSESPCLIEKQTGCYGEWEHAVDMKLCVPRMRMFGGAVQQWNGTEWVSAVDAGEGDLPYDPRYDAPAPAPWPEGSVPEGESGRCLSAANVAAYVDFCCYHFAASMVDGLTVFQTLSVVVAILTALMGIIPLTLLSGMITSLYQQVVDSWADVRDFGITGKLTEIMACKFDEDGSMSRSQFDAMMDETGEWRADLTDNDERAKWWIAIALMALWGPVGMTIVGKIWGITSYDCSGIDCGWTITFNFETSAEGWSIEPDARWPSQTPGVYTGGGWAATQVTGGGYQEISITIEATGPFTITGAVGIAQSVNSSNSSRNCALVSFDNGSQTALYNKTNYFTEEIEQSWNGSRTSDKLWLISEGYFSSMVLKSLTITGVGEMPTWN